MSPITWPPMGLAENMNDVSIVDLNLGLGLQGFLGFPTRVFRV